MSPAECGPSSGRTGRAGPFGLSNLSTAACVVGGRKCYESDDGCFK